MTRFANNAEGGTNGATVLAGASGSLTPWDAATIAAGAGLIYSNAQVEDGALSYAISTPAAGGATFLTWSTFGTVTTLFARVYVYLTANPVGNLRLIRFVSGANEIAAVVVNATRVLALRDKGGGIAGQMTTVIPLNTWVRVECKVVCAVGPGGVVEAVLFTSKDATTPTETLTKSAQNTTPSISIAQFGEAADPGATTARTFYLDEPVIDTAGYPGPARASGSAALIGAAAMGALGGFGIPGSAALIAAARMAAVGGDLFIGAAAMVAIARLTAAPAAALGPPPGGWGDGPWGDLPWGGVESPFTGRPLIGRDGSPPELPPLVHQIIGVNGVSDYPDVVGGFTADEDAGFATLAGYVEPDRVRDLPGVYTDGAQWLVYDSATGLVVAGGDLLTPSIGEGGAGLKADGWAKRLARKGARLMYSTRGYAQVFVPQHSEPFGAAGAGYFAQAEQKFQLSTAGALRWSTTKGSSSWALNDHNGFVASFVGLDPGVRRITGHVNVSAPGEEFMLRAATATGVTGVLTNYVNVQDLSGGGTDWDFDVTLPVSTPILNIDIIRLAGGASIDWVCTVTDLEVFGIASDDRWSASDVARDVAGRLGFAAAVEDSGFGVLPLDVGVDGVPQDALDAVALLAGMFYRVTGIAPGVPLLELRRAGSIRWEVIDPEFPVDPVPLPRYDSVLVPYTLSNGVATSVLEVTADAIGRPPLPLSRAYGPVPLQTPVADAIKATQLGQQVLAMVYPPRFAGTCTFGRVYSAAAGFGTAHEVHTGDSLALPLAGGLVLPIRTLRRDAGVVAATFDDGVVAADRLVARRNRRAALVRPQ